MRVVQSNSTTTLTKFERTYGHMFLSYREGVDWFYEVVAVMRRALVGSIAVLLAAHPFERRAALFACTVIFLVLQAVTKPYFRKSDNTNGVVVLSAVCCVAGLELAAGDSASVSSDEAPYRAASAVA